MNGARHGGSDVAQQLCPAAKNITLVATMRNEGPYILEWVAYHRLIGFTDILICSNDCVDGSPDLLDALQDCGLVAHIRCAPAPDEKAQLFAYQEAQTRLAQRWPDALMVLDADEYLNVHVGLGTVNELLAAMQPATAMMINWRIFGSAGHERWSSDRVTHRYRRAAARSHGVNRSFKTLFTKPDAYHCPLLPHGPGFAKPERVAALRAINGAGEPLNGEYVRAEAFLQAPPGAVRWDLAQVNHYNTRAWQDYLCKHHRGGGLGPERWDRDSNWAAFDRNEEEDLTIQQHVPALEDALSHLLAKTEIRDAYARCLHDYGRHVAALVGAQA